ncbi:plasmid pRiA4b ORF-3 family protein [Candidatus Poriferisodalis sp.]|uniref:plasmid pRiA4b ORF-3 family protein n=1 Tax=Candidatus Poriferisodalis sp. TaxID=3101277 RepID=UPI003B525447
MATVHTLKISLKSVKPRVWRRIEVPSNIALHNLAGLLVRGMGWEGYHLHSFEIDGVTYQRPGPFDDSPFGRQSRDESKYRLGTVLGEVGAKMRWDYDFGDGWEHDILVEAIVPAEAGVTYPRCVAGRRACPPEDCGGWWGYANLLEAIADKQHPDHQELTEWLGHGFNPVHFDPGEATRAM